MSSLVRAEKLRRAFSRTAFGSVMSRKSTDWGWSFMKDPGGRSVDLTWIRSPGSRRRVCIIHCGKYTLPSSATNSRTPQCVSFPLPL